MAEQKKETLLLDLDSAEFIKKMLHARGQLEGLGDADNLSGLIKGLTTATKVIGVVGTAALAAKTAFDWTVEGESIRAINYQFENLTKNAGIATEELKEGLKKAADGLVDDTELLKSANKAIVQMGTSAKKLPDVFELARKATAGFGGNLMENFENINRAIATGQTRFLKSIGLTVDADKAYKDYAKSIGRAVSTLTEQEKRQATLNAVIEQGQRAYKGIDVDITKTANTWQQLKTTVSEIGEVLILFFEKTAGPTIRNLLEWMSQFAKSFKTNVTAAFGEGTEQINAKIEVTKGQITSLTNMMLEAKAGSVEETSLMKQITAAQERLKKLRAALQETKGEAEGLGEKGGTGKGAEDDKEAKERNEKIQAQESAYQKNLLQLRQQRLDAQQNIATNEEQAERVHYEQMGLIASEYQQKRDEIDLKEQQGIITKQQHDAMIEELEGAHVAKMAQMENDLADKKIAAMERVDQSRANADTKLATGMKAASAKAAKEWSGMGKVGERAFNVLAKRAGDAFIAMGEGSQDAGEAMRGFMLGSIADIAEAEGRMLLASVLVNPAHGAAGAALLVLAGILRSQAKSSKSIGGGGEGGGGAAEPSSATPFEEKPDQAEKLQKKTMTVNFMGDYLETQETQTRLLDLLRQGSDATDFRYNKIGV